MPENFDYHFGIHSNVPECCAKWYQEKVNLKYTNIGLTFRPEYQNDHWDISYVVCDECNEKVKQGIYKPNKIHYCNKDDPSGDCLYFLKEIYDYR